MLSRRTEYALTLLRGKKFLNAKKNFRITILIKITKKQEIS